MNGGRWYCTYLLGCCTCGPIERTGPSDLGGNACADRHERETGHTVWHVELSRASA